MTGMAHEEIAELLGAYALDAVDDHERDAIDAHLPTCPRCTAEVADHREVAAMMAHSGAPAPDGLWSRIVESLEEAPPAMSLAVHAPAPPILPEVASLDRRRDERRARSRRWLPAGAAAAAAVLVLGIVAGVTIGADGSRSSDAPVAAASLEDIARVVLNDPEARKVSFASEDGELAASAAIDDEGSGFLLGQSLPALDESETYQLWGVSENVVSSLGGLGASPRVVAFHVDDSIESLVITREVAGGVPSSVNGPLLAGEIA